MKSKIFEYAKLCIENGDKSTENLYFQLYEECKELEFYDQYMMILSNVRSGIRNSEEELCTKDQIINNIKFYLNI